jgi:inosine-uridine nucleoside N-ribohydrolase
MTSLSPRTENYKGESYLNRVVLDVDTGIDDAQALLFALRSPKISIEGITTVCGNIDVDQASENTLKILDLAKVTDLQVARGASQPLTRLPHHVPLIHGSKGLGDTQLSEPMNQLTEQPALTLLTNIVRTYPKQVTVICLGPLTNIASAIQQNSRFARDVQKLVIMGGCYHVTPFGYGNVTPVAEFNIWADPEAAAIVFNSGLNITAVGLDVTHDPTACLQMKHIDKLAALNTPVASFIAELCRFQIPTTGGIIYLHDPITVATVIDPNIVTTQPGKVDVEVEGLLTRGMTVFDRRPKWLQQTQTARHSTTNICTRINGQRFIDLFLQRIA